MKLLLASLVCCATVSAQSTVGSGGIALAQKAFPNVVNAKGELVQPWTGRTPRDLHQEYNTIFKYGNRNAASHLWSTFLIERAVFLNERTFLEVASGYCAVSGSPVTPHARTRYKMRLQKVDGSGIEEGFMYYCCWPCVCDTQDFIRADTYTIRTADRGEQSYSVAVIGNPCNHPEKLTEPFIQPFDRRSTTIADSAREVRCHADGTLEGATVSDHGHIIISMFFNSSSIPEKVGDAPQFQDEHNFASHCEDRKENGYNSGMGEIFRRVAAISPLYPGALPSADAAYAADQATGSSSGGNQKEGTHDEF